MFELKKVAKIIDRKINQLIPENKNVLGDAMRYCLFSGGKRLRPFLVIETAKLFNIENEDIYEAACAVEFLHNYTLIHDDLPVMDNDDYRRGQLSCHKKYNEATAILAGDALLTLSFEILSSLRNTSSENKCELIKALSQAAGYQGLCLGQDMDLKFEKSGKLKNTKQAKEINKLKTGKLFTASIEMGCILGNAHKKNKNLLLQFAENFGQAFQLRDDIIDKEIQPAKVALVNNDIKKLVDLNNELLYNFKDKAKSLVELNSFLLTN